MSETVAEKLAASVHARKPAGAGEEQFRLAESSAEVDAARALARADPTGLIERGGRGDELAVEIYGRARFGSELAPGIR